ncbi:unnamed protein product [Amoebophrya sp. A120]|nr:unnamed protein product [Amoebophrya sp. A120]|eukprot:GSA120T00015561001.1
MSGMSTDRNTRHGYKGTGQATAQDRAMDRRDRLRRLAMESIDLSKDPYFMMNHVGTFECKLCLTVHTNEGSYLAHTQGKKHQINLARRQEREKKLAAANAFSVPVPKDMVKKTGTIKIGRPGYKVTKEREPTTKQKALLFEIEYPSIEPDVIPRHRFMSCYEQKKESPDMNFQYLLIAADPYETIAFKVPNMEIDRGEDGKFYEVWDKSKKTYTLQIWFKDREFKELPGLAQNVRETNLAFHGGGGFTR